MIRRLGSFFLLAGVVIPAAAYAADLSVCDDPDPPPYAYLVRDANNRPTGEMVGSSVELIETAFAKLGMNLRQVTNLPWARCLRAVENGEIDFAADGYFDAERAMIFDFSVHYATLTPQIFFNKAHPPRIASIKDLPHYRGCGLIGASYAHYGLRAEDLDLSVFSYGLLIKKLKAGHCDYIAEELETIEGFKMLGEDFLDDPAIGHMPIADAEPPHRFLLARKGGQAASLLPAFNQIVSEMIRNGEAERIWRKYAGDMKFNP